MDAYLGEGVVLQLDSNDCAEFFNDLRTSRREIVPVIGAGLGVEPGAPSAATLARHLHNVGDLRTPAADNLFAVAQQAAEKHGEAWLQKTVAEYIASREVKPSPVLQALAKVQTGLVLTTNYDLAIEHSARAVGKEVVSLTLDDLPYALQNDPEKLRVLHLHGVVTKPETIVLSEKTYRAALADERMQMVTRALGSEFRLLFLGHSLSKVEEHLRRDFAWAARVRSTSGIGRKHLLLSHVSGDQKDVPLDQAELFRAAGVQAVVVQDTDLRRRSVDIAASILAGSSREIRSFPAATVREARDPNYMPLPVAEVPKDVESFSGVDEGRYLWKIYSSGHTLAPELDATVPRLLIVAGGGHGKTQELHQIGFRSGNALYKRLRSFSLFRNERDPGVHFVREMDDAESYQPVEKLDISGLEAKSYVFLLDGLDEVPAAERPALVSLLEAVSREYPQHRYVVTTRLMASMPSRIEGFSTYLLKPDNEWLERYAESRSVRRDELHNFLSLAPGMSELASIPIYASAIVDRVHNPNDAKIGPLSLILSTTARDVDARIMLRQNSLNLWLNRIALFLEAQNEVSIPLGKLTESRLHDGIPSLYPSLEFLNELAERALLLLKPDSVSFVANIIQEARSAEALRCMDDGGLEFLSKYVVMSDNKGAGAIRDSWTHTLWLLFPMASPAVRRLIAEADPLLAARAAVISTDREEWDRAMWTIWKAYSERQIWLDRNHGARYQDDEGALEKLAEFGLSEDFKSELLSSLESDSRIQRGNALVVLSAASVSDLPQLLARFIHDEDPVVRRRAALAAFSANLEAMSAPLAKQAYIDSDDMAQETLIGCAIDLASTDEEAVAHAVGAPDPLRRKALGQLFSRIGRSRSLELVEADTPNLRPLLKSIVDSSSSGSENIWTVSQSACLARIFASMRHESSLDSKITAILRQRPLATIWEWLKFPITPRIDFEFFWLLEQLTTLQVEQLSQNLESNAGDGLDPDSRRHVLDLSAQLLQGRKEGPKETRRHQPEQHEVPTVQELILGGYKERVLRLSASTDVDLTPAQKSTVKGWVEAEFLRLSGTQAFAPAPSQGRFDLKWSLLAQWAALLDVALLPKDWPSVTRFELERGESAGIAWITGQATPESWHALEEQIEDWPNLSVAMLAQVAQGISRSLAQKVFQAISASEESEDWKDGLLQKLADECEPSVLDSLLNDEENAAWVLPTRVKLGSCQAETRLLRTHTFSTDAFLAAVGARRWQPWIENLRCTTSAPTLFAAIRTALIDGTEFHDMETAMRALDRCAGSEAEKYYDLLISDHEIPGAAFLYYQKRIALDALTENKAREVASDTHDLATRIVTFVQAGCLP
ncbi:SIR2 family protein [Arthrobacter sp. M2012083]|uniref:SIR2 family protein n=1 Tax=Arthrobacter sp. M2012083 TaxID=1197706 RepID=UPI0003131148|nr:SIR2 family protein [Arthrobacter sp. M2012083]